MEIPNVRVEVAKQQCQCLVLRTTRSILSRILKLRFFPVDSSGIYYFQINMLVEKLLYLDSLVPPHLDSVLTNFVS